MANISHPNAVYARDCVTGKIYDGGEILGEVQKDGNGTWWWKRPDGAIQMISPDPSSVFYYLREVDRG